MNPIWQKIPLVELAELAELSDLSENKASFHP